MERQLQPQPSLPSTSSSSLSSASVVVAVVAVAAAAAAALPPSQRLLSGAARGEGSGVWRRCLMNR